MSTVTELLARVSEIRKKHEMIADLTGERFNVFSILGLQSAETRTHSAFLRELLDPNGSHGLKDAFLKAFIRMLKSKGCKLDGWNEDQDLAAKVETELHVGFKSEDLSKGGRIDLVITPKSGVRRILIENKIYAGDQECQLVRYHNHDPNALLLYLTLHGVEAGEGSTKNGKTGQKLESLKDYFSISYCEDILVWLEKCAKEASARPFVRETLVQYGHLIRTLTQQNSSSLMTQEITDAVLASKDTLLAFDSLASSREAIDRKLLESLEVELKDLGGREGFDHEKSNIDLQVPEILFVDSVLENSNLGIGFGVEGGRWYFGFWRINAGNSDPGSETIEKITALFGPVAGVTKWWPVCRWWPEVGNWTKELGRLADFHFDRTSDGQSPLVLEVSTRLKEMKRIAREVLEGS